MLLGKIVGTADVKDSLWKQPEGPGLKALTEGGIMMIHTMAAPAQMTIKANEFLFGHGNARDILFSTQPGVSLASGTGIMPSRVAF